MVAATGLVTSSGIVNATGLVSNSNLVNTANIVTNSSLAEQLSSVVQTGEKLNSLVHPGGGGGDLDREKLHTLIHTGDLDTVQLVHSYNLPPSAEKEQHTVVEQLLLQASGLQQVGRLFVREKKQRPTASKKPTRKDVFPRSKQCNVPQGFLVLLNTCSQTTRRCWS